MDPRVMVKKMMFPENFRNWPPGVGLMAGPVHRIICRIARNKPGKSRVGRRESGMSPGKPDQEAQGKRNGQGHDAAQGIFWIRMVIAMDKKDKMASHSRIKLEMKNVPVSKILKKGPDQKSAQKSECDFPTLFCSKCRDYCDNSDGKPHAEKQWKRS